MTRLETIYESEEEYWFRLEMNEKMRVEFDIALLDGIWRWNYFCFIEGYVANHFETKDKFFLPVDLFEPLSKEITEKINNAFYEIIRQIKHHPGYRLKVMNMIDKEIRKVWNEL
jgi:hypothetical protein